MSLLHLKYFEPLNIDIHILRNICFVAPATLVNIKTSLFEVLLKKFFSCFN